MSTTSERRTEFDADESAALRAIDWSAAAGRVDCPDPALLTAAEDGLLDRSVTARVQAHVAACATCRQLAADLARIYEEDAGDGAVERIEARVRSTATWRPPTVWIAAGAGLAAAAAIIFALLRPTAVVTPDQTTTPVATIADAKATAFRPDRPKVTPPDVNLTLRSDTTTRVSLATQIGDALDLLDAGDVRGAIARLDPIAASNPRSRDAQLALGAALLHDRRPADAMRALDAARAALSAGARDDEIDWFLAIALAQTGARDRARVLLDPLCRREGGRRTDACAGLMELK
jgi:hypothetical protein